MQLGEILVVEADAGVPVVHDGGKASFRPIRVRAPHERLIHFRDGGNAALEVELRARSQVVVGRCRAAVAMNGEHRPEDTPAPRSRCTVVRGEGSDLEPQTQVAYRRGGDCNVGGSDAGPVLVSVVALPLLRGQRRLYRHERRDGLASILEVQRAARARPEWGATDD